MTTWLDCLFAFIVGVFTLATATIVAIALEGMWANYLKVRAAEKGIIVKDRSNAA